MIPELGEVEFVFFPFVIKSTQEFAFKRDAEGFWAAAADIENGVL